MANWIDRLKSAFSAVEDRSPEIALTDAVAALLLEAAKADDVIDDAEREIARKALVSVLGLPTEDARAAIERAEDGRDHAADMVRFTRVAKEGFDYADRVRLIEAVWEVALADDETTPDEDAFVRRLAGLVYVEDQDRGAARRRVLERRNA